MGGALAVLYGNSTMNAEGAGSFLARSKGRGGVRARRGRLREELLSSCGPF